MPEKRRLVLASKLLDESTSQNVRLYFIVRQLREGISKNEKALNKYKYECIKINVDPDLQQYFLDLIKKQLVSTLNNADVEFTEYDIIDDDLKDRVYTYAINNASSFYHLLNDKMKAGVDIPYVSSLKNISNDLCAYSICIEDGASIRLVSFRRISKGKIATENSKGLKAIFRPNDKRLVSADGESINFDDKLDCIFFDGQFYVFHKRSFEALAGLDDEYRQLAHDVLEDIAETELISGLNLLVEEAGRSRLVAKQLAKISKSGGHKNIDANRIAKMKEICESLGLNLKIDDGRIVVDDLSDAKLLIRLLDQYYVSCMQTGDPFGSHAKKKLNKSNS